DDARRFGVIDDSFARVTTDYGQCILKAVVTEQQQRGMLFAPIHWSGATSSTARVGALVAPFTDPYSGPPEFEGAPGGIVAHGDVFRGFGVARQEIKTAEQAWGA